MKYNAVILFMPFILSPTLCFFLIENNVVTVVLTAKCQLFDLKAQFTIQFSVVIVSLVFLVICIEITTWFLGNKDKWPVVFLWLRWFCCIMFNNKIFCHTSDTCHFNYNKNQAWKFILDFRKIIRSRNFQTPVMVFLSTWN